MPTLASVYANSPDELAGNPMVISIINYSNQQLSDEQVQTAVRAINRQIEGDFAPYWGLGAELRLEGRSCPKPQKQSPMDMRGDAVIYLWDGKASKDALGYHDQNNRGIPYGFVYPALSKEMGEHWSATLSHEVLELIADPEANLLVQGPHPTRLHDFAFYWYEMCDAVQNESYQIDGITVSNFVLPLYFTSSDERGGRNDYLSRAHKSKTLASFGLNPGGYFGYFDPVAGKHQTFSRRGDKIAQKRLEIKGRAEATRRATRYQRLQRGAAASA
jgi:hypothetical protein